MLGRCLHFMGLLPNMMMTTKIDRTPAIEYFKMTLTFTIYKVYLLYAVVVEKVVNPRKMLNLWSPYLKERKSFYEKLEKKISPDFV